MRAFQRWERDMPGSPAKFGGGSKRLRLVLAPAGKAGSFFFASRGVVLSTHNQGFQDIQYRCKIALPAKSPG
jgi:hypothetical protein